MFKLRGCRRAQRRAGCRQVNTPRRPVSSPAPSVPGFSSPPIPPPPRSRARRLLLDDFARANA
ncbi:uncharacterized protein MICPUCDRAFT_66721 [Micromonas pusilla CCMP1545]|uniref:Predicted protein n=1 Tax=Micromonas pusilla (strain CCMP1545) TaxID=564608 RepID=C1N4B8_MICPC|nr:uncharacterized protein MICPUCDRAFT_66721 [Micromonas pusilla CCMP1545]EEH52911.1 predicted protein [Micromonas pusilla CCMP1545]|eukprot:XP_003062972.1 predicted protein [Micromonas pusilla CCMP1545]